MSTYEEIREDAIWERYTERYDAARGGTVTCAGCGCWLRDDEGTYCDTKDCGARICSACVVVETVPVQVAGHEAKTLRFECPDCVQQRSDPDDEPDTQDPDPDRQAAEVER